MPEISVYPALIYLSPRLSGREISKGSFGHIWTPQVCQGLNDHFLPHLIYLMVHRLRKNGLWQLSGFSIARLMYRALMRFMNPHRLCPQKVLMTTVRTQALAGANRYCFITAVSRRNFGHPVRRAKSARDWR
jgi:hypothetical protein